MGLIWNSVRVWPSVSTWMQAESSLN